MTNQNTTCWIGTSWKMHKTLAEAEDFAKVLAQAASDVPASIQPFVIPPFTAVREVKKLLADTKVWVGAQNMHWEDAGAWTGEISPVMLTDCQLDMVELGHSERRCHFGETDQSVGYKTAAAIKHGLIPLICIGETLAERESGKAQAVLRAQVTAALEPLVSLDVTPPVLLAYEPVWAIGKSGIPASADYADARHQEIRHLARTILDRDIPCLYGGSVSADNCQELLACPHIDGLFIGRGAWDVQDYLRIIQLCATGKTQ